MISKSQAVAAHNRQEFYLINNQGTKVIRVRVMGKCKTWKRDEARFQLPVKFGMYESDYITDTNAARFYATEAEAQTVFNAGKSMPDRINALATRPMRQV